MFHSCSKWWITQLYCLTLTRWIAIYPVGNVIQRLNNRGLEDRVWLIQKTAA